MYLHGRVSTDARMQEARSRGSKFIGTVAAVQDFRTESPPKPSVDDVSSWSGVTKRHIHFIASILGGDFSVLIRGSAKAKMGRL